MNPAIAESLRTGGGVASHTALLQVATRHAVHHAVVAGHVARLHPRVYVDTRRRGDLTTRLRAALLYAGPRAAFSHTTGLHLWGLPVPDLDTLHLVLPQACSVTTGTSWSCTGGAGSTSGPRWW